MSWKIIKNKMKDKVKNINFFKLFLKFNFLFSLYFIFSQINLNYLSTTAPDFQYYVDYLDYFYGDLQTTGREQGLAYFYFVSLILKLLPDFYSNFSTPQLISNAIQLSNLLLYLFGVQGLYLLLKLKNFTSSQIFLSLIALNFLPQTINLIVTMKPEILAFTLVPWILYCFELFLRTDQYKFLYLTIIPNSVLLTSKATILGMVLLFYLFFVIVKKINLFNLDFVKVGFLFVLSLIPIIKENISANGKNVFEHTNTVPWMQEVADVSFLYNINFLELLTSPFRHNHADSLIGLVLLDSFGDYFQWYAFNDQSTFSFNNINFQSIWYVSHWKQFISLSISVIFYLLIIYFIVSMKSSSFYLSLPIYGIAILLLQAYGFPQKNFNKASAELFKTHYFAFFLLISFTFLIAMLLKKKKILGYLMFVTICFSTVFMYGFFDNNDKYMHYKYVKNQYVTTCSLNSFFYDGLSDNCMKKELVLCKTNNIIYNTRSLYNPELNISIFSSTFTKEKFINSEGKIRFPRNFKECIELLDKGYETESIYKNKIKHPLFTIIYLTIIFITPFVLMRVNKKSKYENT